MLLQLWEIPPQEAYICGEDRMYDRSMRETVMRPLRRIVGLFAEANNLEIAKESSEEQIKAEYTVIAAGAQQNSKLASFSKTKTA